jgi:hypothetical protein
MTPFSATAATIIMSSFIAARRMAALGFGQASQHLLVMAGLLPAIHDLIHSAEGFR